jgi:hypothetical protein
MCYPAENLVISAGQRLAITYDASVQEVPISGTRNLTVQSGAIATISGLALYPPGSSGATAGGIANAGVLTLTNSFISSCSSTTEGGGIFNSGTLTLTHSSVVADYALPPATAQNSLRSQSHGSARRLQVGVGRAMLIGGAGAAPPAPVSTSASSAGGGIFNQGTLTIIDSEFANNTSSSGGAIFNQGTLTLADSIIRPNFATFGGGIFNQGTMALTNTTLSVNQARSAGGRGGGIFNKGVLTLTGTTLSGNQANGAGGGIDNAGTLQGIGSTIVINHASLSGGGILNEPAGTIVLTDTTISNNDAEDGGGGIDNAGRISMLDTALVGNNADGGSGGGILEESASTLSVANSTLAGNSASQSGNGGAIASVGSDTVALRNATVSGNSAPNGVGGGIAHQSSGSLMVTNTILSGNAASDPATADCAGTASAGGYNPLSLGDGYNLLSARDGCMVVAQDQYAVQATSTGSSSRRLANLSYHGGATQTLPPLPDTGDSAAIGTGDVTVCRAAPISGKDQRGFARGPLSCDIGAYDTYADSNSPTTFYVDQLHGRNTTSPCTGPGARACPTIDQAIGWATGGGTIDIAPGVYPDEHLTLSRPYLSLQGNGAGVVLDGEHTGTVVTVQPGVIVDLTGLVIRNGHNAIGGGGIANYGTLTLSNSEVTGNDAPAGGGVYNEGALLVSQSSMLYNSAVREVTSTYAGGGGIASLGGAVWVRSRSLIAHNDSAGIAHNGGGILSSTSSLLVTDSAVSDNAVTLAGGTDYICFIGLCDEGGGIYATGFGNAGGADTTFAPTIVKRSTISGNQSDSVGGGISASTLSLTLVDTTISGNTDTGQYDKNCQCNDFQDGGGLSTYGAIVTMLNSTVAGNHAPGTGGVALHNDGQDDVENSIVIGNSGGPSSYSGIGGPDCAFTSVTPTGDYISVTPTGEYNLFSSSGGCQTTINATNVFTDTAHAKLDPLGDYGGPTQSVRPGPGSPAIGKANAQVCATIPVDGVDQRGLPRPPLTCDIGAYDTNGDLQSFTIRVQPGWNLISFPLAPTVTLSASAVLASVLRAGGGSLAAIYGLTNNQWSPYRIGQHGTQIGNDFPLQVGQGYLLYSDRAASYTETGSAPAGASWSLVAGWNLVGVPSGAPGALVASTVLDDVLAGSASNGLAAIYGLTSNQWSPYRIDHDGAQSGNDFMVAEGRGYLLYSSRSVTLPVGVSGVQRTHLRTGAGSAPQANGAPPPALPFLPSGSPPIPPVPSPPRVVGR